MICLNAFYLTCESVLSKKAMYGVGHEPQRRDVDLELNHF